MAAGASGEDSAWHDLIANFTAEPDPGSGDPPWPARENLAGPPQADPGLDTDPAMMLDLTDDTDPELGPGARPGRWSSEPRIIRPAGAVPPPPPAADEENFVPPVPPPLLFGGPAYLLIATMAGWAIPGWAAFLAVAAFVGGFATLVIRMSDRPPRDSGPDDGAVL